MSLELTERVLKYFELLEINDLGETPCAFCNSPLSTEELALKAIKDGQKGLKKNQIYHPRCVASFIIPYQS